MKKFNDSVVYIRDGKAIPAIVLKSQDSGDGELLTLLFADPNIGPSLVAQGTFRGIAQVITAVAPMAEGKLFGWDEGLSAPAESPVSASDEMLNTLMPLVVDLSKTVIDIDPSMEISPDGTLQSANTLLQKMHAILNQKPEAAPEQPPTDDGKPLDPTEGSPAPEATQQSSENS